MILIFGLIFIFSHQAIYGQERIKSFLNNVTTFYVPCTNLEIGYCSIKGERQWQQDAIAIQDDVIMDPYKIDSKSIIQYEDIFFLGVFDGHGLAGTSVAHDCATDLVQSFKKPITNNPFSLIIKSLNEIKCAQESGTTACVCAVSYNQLIFYNLGDSRAIWGQKENEQTRDHSTKNTEECGRVLRAGGSYYDHYFYSNSTTSGKVMFSRALGDTDLLNYFLLNTPESYSLDLATYPNAIIGSDGCFDSTNNTLLWDIYQQSLENKLNMVDAVHKILFSILICESPFISDFLINKLNISQEMQDNVSLGEKMKNIHEKYSNTVHYSSDKAKRLIQRENYNLLIEHYNQEIVAYIMDPKNDGYVQSFCSENANCLHDNTSFILLHCLSSSAKFKLLNKERFAIMALLFVFVSIGKYWSK